MLNMTLVLELDFLSAKLWIDMDGCYPYLEGSRLGTYLNIFILNAEGISGTSSLNTRFGWFFGWVFQTLISNKYHIKSWTYNWVDNWVDFH